MRDLLFALDLINEGLSALSELIVNLVAQSFSPFLKLRLTMFELLNLVSHVLQTVEVGDGELVKCGLVALLNGVSEMVFCVLSLLDFSLEQLLESLDSLESL